MATYREALGVAHLHGASMQALVASTALARLARTREARQELATLYASFTEGFATQELHEARLLLDEATPPG